MGQNDPAMGEAEIKRMLRKKGLEEPSPDFAKLVLSKIAPLPVPSGATVYKPLIPKWAWWAMAILVGGLCAFVFQNLWTGERNSSWAFFAQMEQLAEYHIFARLFKLEVSEVFLYGIVGLTLFLFVQVIILKNYWNKRRVLY
jgi:hypothetical protein